MTEMLKIDRHNWVIPPFWGQTDMIKSQNEKLHKPTTYAILPEPRSQGTVLKVGLANFNFFVYL